ncbi:DUF4913 domain-containing protein [Nocardiopsis terrae]
MSSTDDYQDALAAMMAFVDSVPEESPASPPEPVSAPESGGWDEPPQEQKPELFCGSVDEFVREVILPIYQRQVGVRGSRRWSAQWWRNAEAVSRLDSMWRSWEHLRQDGATGMSTWWRDHADYHMERLLSPEGPFGRSEDANLPGQPLPYQAPPPGLFTSVHNTSSEA